MTTEKIIDFAQIEGFEAAILSPSDLEFDFSFRKYCEENLCGNYGASPYCPPLCPCAEKLKGEVLKHKSVLVLKSAHKIPDLADIKAIKTAGEAHNAATLSLLGKFPDFSGALALCSSTDIEIPQNITAACLSAYCVNVSKMAEKCGMSYTYKDSILSLFGFITLD